jgi:hypothetical protein
MAWMRLRRRWLYIAGGIVVAAALVALAPTIVAATGLRHWAVTRALGNPDLQATVETASFGWFSPVRLAGVDVVRNDKRLHIGIDQVEADRSWLEIARSLPEVGALAIRHPDVDLVADQDAWDGWRLKHPRFLVADIRDAQFRVRPALNALPVVDLEDLDLTAHIEPAAYGQVLWVEPVQLLDREPMTRELLERGLRLVAPVIARATRLEGSVSFELDQFRIPLQQTSDPDAIRDTQIEGRLRFHEVSASLKNPVLVEIAGLVARLLDRDIPSRVRIVEETEIHFHCVKGRVHHFGMAFVLPEMSSELIVLTSGSVGLDETLDLVVEIPLPVTELHDGPLMRAIADRPLRLQVQGTLDKPQLGLVKGDEWLQGLASDLLEDGRAAEVVGNVMQTVRGLLEERGEETATLDALLEGIRQRREARRARRERAAQEREEQE